MSLSPWMYTIAFGSECGRLCTTKMMKKPGYSEKSKSINYVCVYYWTKCILISQLLI